MGIAPGRQIAYPEEESVQSQGGTMVLGRAGFLTAAAAVMVMCSATAFAPAHAGEEAYYSLEKLKVPVGDGGAPRRMLVVEIDLAVASLQDKEKMKALHKQISAAVEQALSAKPVEAYEEGNLAAAVKRVARVAAQRVAGKEIAVTDALVRDVRLR